MRKYTLQEENILQKVRSNQSQFSRARSNTILDQFYALSATALQPHDAETINALTNENQIQHFPSSYSQSEMQSLKDDSDAAKFLDQSSQDDKNSESKDQFVEKLQEEQDHDQYQNLEFQYQPADIISVITQSLTKRYQKLSENLRRGGNFQDTKDLLSKIKQKSMLKVHKIRNKINSKKQKVYNQIQGAKRLITRQISNNRSQDKFLFMIGVNALLLKTYLIAIDPCGWFLYINAIYATLMIFLRFFRFKKQGLHYYLFDFCYWANYLVFISAIFFPNNPHLFNVSYFYGVGVLSWAILTFRNSLIFHSIDHMTSLYIHSQPMAVMTILRWSKVDNCPNIEFFSPVYSLHYIVGFYTIWALIYYIINFVLLWDRINKNHYEVLYLYVEKQKKTMSARLIHCMGGKYKAPLFMLTHIILTVISGIFAIIQFQFQALNYIGVFLILSVALWNGSNYYFEYFSRKYERSLEAIEKLQAQAIIVQQLQEQSRLQRRMSSNNMKPKID